jgi:hypothetical protein
MRAGPVLILACFLPPQWLDGRLPFRTEEEASMAEEKPDIGRLIDEAAKAIGLPIAPEYRANVIANYERAMVIAKPLLEVELDDALTAGPVFRP